MEEAHILKVVGSNPGAVYWMDIKLFHIVCCKNCNDVCLKRPKITEKDDWDWPIFKNQSIFELLDCVIFKCSSVLLTQGKNKFPPCLINSSLTLPSQRKKVFRTNSHSPSAR